MKIKQTLLVIIFFLNAQHLFSQLPNKVSQKYLLVYSINEQQEKKIKEIKPDIFICGHSHILKVINDKKNDLLHINPGAAGDYGIHQVKTMIKFTIDKDNIKDLKIIELKR